MPRIPDQASRTFPKGTQHGYSYLLRFLPPRVSLAMEDL